MKQVVDHSHWDDDFFCLKKLIFQDKNGRPLEKTIPVVKNIELYLHHICTKRSLDLFSCKIKVGIDFGSESLKVGMYFIHIDDMDEDFENSSSKENFNSQNRVLILAMGNLL